MSNGNGNYKSVFGAMPSYDDRPDRAALQSLSMFATRGPSAGVRLIVSTCSTSLLGKTFNIPWAQALDMRAHYFAMLHADMVPSQFWLDTLLAEMDRVGADVISAVASIKDASGYTSTGVSLPDDDFDYRRLTKVEIARLPETFSIEDVPEEIRDGGRDCLLVNTGCMVIDLRQPCWRETDSAGRLNFRWTVGDRITYCPERQRHIVEVSPEDWAMSRFAHRAGLRVFATTKVKTNHWGRHAYTCDVAEGGHETDTEAVEFHETKPGGRLRPESVSA